ncbi:MAG: hypothetical protein ABSE07_07500 [Methanoregula sp.]
MEILQTWIFFFHIMLLTYRAGIINATHLLESDAAKVAAETGIMAHVTQDFQKAIQKKRDNAIIQL